MMEFLSPDFLFRNALLGGLVVAVVCSALGVYMVLRRLVLLSVALPQAGAAGIAAVFLLTRHAHVGGGEAGHFLALGGSLGATLGALGLLLLAMRRMQLPAEWGIGALLAIANAATYLFVSLDPKGDLEMSNLLRGELLAIGDIDLLVVLVMAVLTLGLFFLFRRELLLASFDPEFDRTLGRRPERADALLYVLLGGSIALGVMNVGPLVVFGFLVLPALAALRLAPNLTLAFVLSAAVAAASSLGGFGIALHADLPAGPTSVGVAAGFWMLAGLVARVRAHRVRAARAVALLALLVLPLPFSSLPLGCAASGPEAIAEGHTPTVARGTLPEADPARPISVAPFRNETGEPLHLGSANPLKDLGRALGDPFATEPRTVVDALQVVAWQELVRRGLAVLPPDQTGAFDHPPTDAADAGRTARRAGLAGPVLVGTLRRFTLTRSRLLLVRLDLELVDPESGETLWRGEAHRPVPIQASLTMQEVVNDAGPRIFAEAFAPR